MTEREQKVFDFFTKDTYRLSRRHLKERVLLREAKLMAQLLDNCLVVREPIPTESGTSDLILCYNGCFIACELKAMDGVVSPQQLKFIKNVRAAGGLADVCESLKDIWELLMRAAQRS